MHDLERAYILGHGLQQHLRRPHPREQLQPEAAPERNKSGRRVSQTASLISAFPNPRSPNPSQVLNPHPRPTDLWIRLFIDPSGALPNPIHARFICASEPIHQKTPPKTQMQGLLQQPARACVGVGPSTLSATKSTTDSAFSGAVRPPEVMPRQRSLSVGGGGGWAPSPAGAAAARGRAKHQARPLTGKTTTRACIARRGGRRRGGGGGDSCRGGGGGGAH